YRHGFYIRGNDNTISDCVFEDLGDTYSHSHDSGFAGVHILNSSKNVVHNCTFTRLADPLTVSGRMHGVYISEGSDENTVDHSTFTEISGDGVRIRGNASSGANGNQVFSNTFTKTGSHADVSDVPNDSTECQSWENMVYDNISNGDRNCDAVPVTFISTDGKSCAPPGATAR